MGLLILSMIYRIITCAFQIDKKFNEKLKRSVPSRVFRGSVRSGKCPVGDVSIGDVSIGDVFVGDVSRYAHIIMKKLLKNIPGGNFKGTLDVEAYHKLDDATLKELGMYNDNYLVCLS